MLFHVKAQHSWETCEGNAEDPSPMVERNRFCYLRLTGITLGHFWLLYRCSRFAPCTRSPNTPPSSCFSPLRNVPLSLNAYTVGDHIVNRKANGDWVK